MEDIVWFKKNIEPCLKSFETKHKFFDNGDFGDLHQVEFNSEEKGGEIDFWSSGWLSICLVDYIKGEAILNVFLEPHQAEEKENAFKKLQELLK